VLVLNFVNRTNYPTNDQRVVSGQTMPVVSHQLVTSQVWTSWVTAVVCRWTSHSISSIQGTEVQFCNWDCRNRLRIQMWRVSTLFTFVHSQRTHFDWCQRIVICSLLVYPEFIQLMDDYTVSVVGLTRIVNPSCREDALTMLQ